MIVTEEGGLETGSGNAVKEGIRETVISGVEDEGKGACLGVFDDWMTTAVTLECVSLGSRDRLEAAETSTPVFWMFVRLLGTVIDGRIWAPAATGLYE